MNTLKADYIRVLEEGIARTKKVKELPPRNKKIDKLFDELIDLMNGRIKLVSTSNELDHLFLDEQKR